MGVETPDAETLRRYPPRAAPDDQQRRSSRAAASWASARLRVSRSASPKTRKRSLQRVRYYVPSRCANLRQLQRVDALPGHGFFAEAQGKSPTATSAATPSIRVLKYAHLTAEQVAAFHRKCFHRFYFRWAYLRENAGLLWPGIACAWGSAGRRSSRPMPTRRTRACRNRENTADLLHRKGLRPDGRPSPRRCGDKTSDRRAVRRPAYDAASAASASGELQSTEIPRTPRCRTLARRASEGSCPRFSLAGASG